MRLLLFATILIATLSPNAHRLAPRPSASPLAAPLPIANLYSPRALRRMRTYLRLRLYEMRALDLERAARAIERKLPVDTWIAPAVRPAPP